MNLQTPLTPDRLLESVSQRLNIKFYNNGRNKALYKAWLIYSAIGALAYHYIYSFDETANANRQKEGSNARRPFKGVSIVSWKRYIKKELYAFCTIIQDAKEYFPDNRKELLQIRDDDLSSDDSLIKNDPKDQWDLFVNELLDQYIQTGCFYKKDYWIAPAPRRTVKYEKTILFERGITPSELHVRISGLGFWRELDSSTQTTATLSEAYGVQDCSYLEKWRDLESSFIQNKKRSSAPPNYSEFLQVSPNPQDYSKFGGYWISTPHKDGKITLGRCGEKGRESYFLYRYSGNNYEQLNLPQWTTNPEWNKPLSGSREYLRIASAILAKQGMLPAIQAELSKDIVVVKIGYLFPPQEQSLFRLYSWPCDFFVGQGKQNFKRAMEPKVYEAFKIFWRKLGYTINETNANQI